MNCQRFETLLTDYIEEKLDRQVRSAIDIHLEECSNCTWLLRNVRELCTDLEHFPEVSVPPTLIDEIMERTSGKPQSRSMWQDFLLPSVKPFLTQRYAFATIMIFVFLSFAVNLAGPEFSASSLSPSAIVAKADHFSVQLYKKWAEFNDFKTRVGNEYELLKEDLLGRLDYHLVTILFKSYSESIEGEKEGREDHQKEEGKNNHEQSN
jgi:hypothetical protein